MNDIDELLRDFRSGLDQPPPGALQRARSRAVGAAGRKAVRPRARWLALPATAIGVTAATITASLMLGQTPGPVAEPTARPATSVPTTVAPPTTAEIIESWARDLEAGPLPPPVGPGQLIIASVRQLQDGQWTERSADVTIERDGLLLVDNAEFGDRGSFQAYVTQQRTEFATIGPSWRYPTAEWLEALDPHPDGLRLACGTGCSDDWQTWNAVWSLVSKGDLVLPPRIRAGLLRLLGALDGIAAAEATVDGRRLWVVAAPTRSQVGSGTTVSYHSQELYIDPVLHRFVGGGTLRTGRAPDLPQCVPFGGPSHPVNPRPTGTECEVVIPLAEPEREMVTLWEQTVVTP